MLPPRHRLAQPPRPQIGICIWRPADRHHGYGRAGIRFITNWAIDHLDLHRLEAWILAGNTVSRRLFETLGFTHEATLTQRYRLIGGWRDVLGDGAGGVREEVGSSQVVVGCI